MLPLLHPSAGMLKSRLEEIRDVYLSEDTRASGGLGWPSVRVVELQAARAAELHCRADSLGSVAARISLAAARPAEEVDQGKELHGADS